MTEPATAEESAIATPEQTPAVTPAPEPVEPGEEAAPEGAEASTPGEKPETPVEMIPRSESNAAWVGFRKANQRASDAEAELARVNAENAPEGEETPLTLEDFDYDEGALEQARIDRAVAKGIKADREKREGVKQQQAQSKKLDTFADRQMEYFKDNPTYEEANKTAAEQGTQFNDDVTELVVTSENGPALHHHLLDNPAEVDRLNALTPTEAAREIGKLEAKIMTTTQPEKRTTSAPDPIETLDPGGNSGKDPLDPNAPDISIEEEERRLAAQWKREHGKG